MVNFDRLSAKEQAIVLRVYAFNKEPERCFRYFSPLLPDYIKRLLAENFTVPVYGLVRSLHYKRPFYSPELSPRAIDDSIKVTIDHLIAQGIFHDVNKIAMVQYCITNGFNDFPTRWARYVYLARKFKQAQGELEAHPFSYKIRQN